MSGDFDKAIDEAVREMLDVEPRADLRARVMRQIAGKNQSRKLLWTAVPLAAAATLILALFLPSKTGVDQQMPTPVVKSTPPNAPPTVPSPVVRTPQRSVPQVVPPHVIATGPSPASSRPRRIEPSTRMAAAAVYAAADDTTGIEPLNALTPIEMAPLAEHRVATAEITVRPLNPIVELQIAPLSPPERRN